MNYNLVYEFEKIPQKQRTSKLVMLSDKDFELIKHIYLNGDKMVTEEDIRARIFDSDLFEDKDVSLEDIVKMASGPYDIDILTSMFLLYIYYVDIICGPVEAKKASKVILCKKKIVGIKTKDVLSELLRRQNLKK